MRQKIKNLKCIGVPFPLNVTDKLDFSWEIEDCSIQHAYTVRIFYADKLIYSHTEETCQQRHYVDRMPELLPLTEYTYEVEVATDRYRETSDKARFITGLISGFDRRAKWISDGSRFVVQSEDAGTPSVYLKKTVNICKPKGRILASICGLGFYELYINGKKAGDSVLDPAFTDYTRAALYSTYEVNELITDGENTFEIILGDGWYNQTTIDTWGFNRAPWRDNPKVIFQLNCGEMLLAATDTSWQVYSGPIVSNALRTGEHWDLTTEQRLIKSAALTAPPGGRIRPQQMPPIRECETLLPVKVTEIKEGILFDFGRSVAGYAEFHLEGDRGARAEFIYSDRLTDGLPDNSTNSMYISNRNLKYQTDSVVLSGQPTVFKPKFVYHGYRYVLAKTFGNLRIREAKAHFVHTDLERIGCFDCSDGTIKSLYDMSLNAILSNYHGFPTDCPQREKNGWTGDAQLSLEACIYNLDMRQAYRKWLDDFKDN